LFLFSTDETEGSDNQPQKEAKDSGLDFESHYAGGLPVLHSLSYHTSDAFSRWKVLAAFETSSVWALGRLRIPSGRV